MKCLQRQTSLEIQMRAQWLSTLTMTLFCLVSVSANLSQFTVRLNSNLSTKIGPTLVYGCSHYNKQCNDSIVLELAIQLLVFPHFSHCLWDRLYLILPSQIPFRLRKHSSSSSRKKKKKNQEKKLPLLCVECNWQASLWEELSVHLALGLRLKPSRQWNNSLVKSNKGPGTAGAARFQHSRPVPLSSVWGYSSINSWEGNSVSFHVWIKESCPTRKNEVPFRSQAWNPLAFLAV